MTVASFLVEVRLGQAGDAILQSKSLGIFFFIQKMVS